MYFYVSEREHWQAACCFRIFHIKIHTAYTAWRACSFFWDFGLDLWSIAGPYGPACTIWSRTINNLEEYSKSNMLIIWMHTAPGAYLLHAPEAVYISIWCWSIFDLEYSSRLHVSVVQAWTIWPRRSWFWTMSRGPNLKKVCMQQSVWIGNTQKYVKKKYMHNFSAIALQVINSKQLG